MCKKYGSQLILQGLTWSDTHHITVYPHIIFVAGNMQTNVRKRRHSLYIMVLKIAETFEWSNSAHSTGPIHYP